MNASLIRTSVKSASRIPYDILNKIFDYVSHMNDTKLRMVVDNKGHMKFRLNLWFSEFSRLNDVNLFKQSVLARQVRLRLHIWPITPGTFHEVEAFEEPRRICDQANVDMDFMRGFVNDGRCYTYLDPASGLRTHAYLECRYYLQNEHRVFRYGSVHYADGTTHVIMGFNTDTGVVDLTVNSTNIWWGDLEAADALLELDEDDEIDIENLPQLQMYM